MANSEIILHYKNLIAADKGNTDLYKRLIEILFSNPATLIEAIFYQRKLVELLPSSLEEKLVLADFLFNAGHFKESLEILDKSYKEDPMHWITAEKMGAVLFFLADFNSLDQLIKHVLSSHLNPTVQCQKKFYIAAIYTAFIKGNFLEAEKLLSESSKLYTDSNEKAATTGAMIYNNYFNSLIKYHKENPSLYELKADKDIHVIGESHCLSPAHITLKADKGIYKFKPYPVLDTKIWNLISPYSNKHKSAFNLCLERIPNNSIALFCFGEIDCRINEGIMKQYRANPAINVAGHIETMLKSYIQLIASQVKEKNLTVIIQGIPAPNLNMSSYPENDVRIFLNVVKYVNEKLKEECELNQLKYLDVYSLTSNNYGFSSGLYHIDGHHLKPEYISFFIDELIKFI
jgi:tetratricopeptide (TPR) repeat protein